jgi:hypothetical protein
MFGKPERATPPADDALEAIADNDLYTGREVKRLLASLTRDAAPYVKVLAASTISGIARSTLKSAAPRYFELQRQGEAPPIRVRRTSGAKGAHWLFHEGDCWLARRQRAAEEPSEAAPPTAQDGTESLIDLYSRKVALEWLPLLLLSFSSSF